MTFSVCGTAEYVPPKVVLKTGHGPSVNLWALGIPSGLKLIS